MAVLFQLHEAGERHQLQPSGSLVLALRRACLQEKGGQSLGLCLCCLACLYLMHAALMYEKDFSIKVKRILRSHLQWRS